MIRLFIKSQYPILFNDWTEVTDESSGIERLKMTFSRKDDVVSRAITNDIVFFGGAYSLIYDKLVTNQGDFVWAKVEIDDFNYTFPLLQIRWNAIECCSTKCEIKAKLTTWNEDLDKYRSLKSTLIWDDEFNARENHPLVRLFVRTFGAANEKKFGVPAAYLRDYANNVCDKIGITLDSTIFNYEGLNSWTGDDYDYDDYFWQNGFNNNPPKRNPYHNAAAISNFQGERTGFEVGQSTPIGLNKISNVLNYNGLQFFTRFGQIFNAKFQIKNGVLKFERKDYFYGTASLWLDLSNEDICLKNKSQENWAYLRLELGYDDVAYAPEGTGLSVADNCGSISTLAFASNIQSPFKEIVEWNNPVSTRQEGELSKVFDEFSNRVQFNNVIGGQLNGHLHDVDNYEFGKVHLDCLSQDSPLNRKEIFVCNRRLNTQSYSNATFQMLGKKGTFLSCSSVDAYAYTLFDNFHFIDDPRRTPNSRGFEAKEPYKRFEYELNTILTCEKLSTFDIDSYIETKKGKASMEDVEFDFYTNNINIKGFV